MLENIKGSDHVKETPEGLSAHITHHDGQACSLPGSGHPLPEEIYSYYLRSRAGRSQSTQDIAIAAPDFQDFCLAGCVTKVARYYSGDSGVPGAEPEVACLNSRQQFVI
jgi:hypothetical protein